jgi:hypothetical protein
LNKGKTKKLLARDLLLLLGAVNIEDQWEEGRLVMSPSEVVIHDNWNPSTVRFNDDIAILIMEQNIQFTNFIRPICLWKSNVEPSVNKGIVVGWGTTGDSANGYESTANMLEVPIIQDNLKCFYENYKLAKIASDTSFCAGKEGIAVCSGDSGSGLSIEVNGISYLKGIVSSSLIDKEKTGCYKENYAIYTNVMKYLDWIENPSDEAAIIPKSTTMAHKTIASTERTISTQSKKLITTRRITTTPWHHTTENSKRFEETCGIMSSSASLIQGGKISTREQFPWVVAISIETTNGWEHEGSGSLISAKHVVASADSVSYGEPFKAFRNENIRLYLGTTKWNSANDPGAVLIDGTDGIEKVVLYPGARNADLSKNLLIVNNLAVVFIKKPIQFSKFVSPVCLLKLDTKASDQVGQIAFGVGYGKDKNEIVTGIRKYVTMTITDDNECKSYWGKWIKNDPAKEYFCTKVDDSFPYFCDNPLFVKIDERWYLRGILNTYGTMIKRMLYEDQSAKLVKWISSITQQ